MNIYRVTTNAMMYTYKNNLMSSKKRLSDATIRVQTERSFNSYAENPFPLEHLQPTGKQQPCYDDFPAGRKRNG